MEINGANFWGCEICSFSTLFMSCGSTFITFTFTTSVSLQPRYVYIFIYLLLRKGGTHWNRFLWWPTLCYKDCQLSLNCGDAFVQISKSIPSRDYCWTPRHWIVIYTDSLTQPSWTHFAEHLSQHSKDIQLSAILELSANPMCVRWCETRRMSVWVLVCLSKQELGGVRFWPRRARTSQRPSAKQQHGRQLTQWLWACLCAGSGNLLTPTQTHKQLQMHMKYTLQTTTPCREDMWSRERTLPQIWSCRNVGLCKQTCLGGDVRSGPGEWVVPTTANAHVTQAQLRYSHLFLLRHF